MPPRYEVVLHNDAALDLETAFAYIYHVLENPFAAYNLFDGVTKQIRKLSLNPSWHPTYRVEPWRSLGYRFTKYKHYIILFTIQESQKRVIVAKISNSRRDLSQLTPPNLD